MSQDRVIDTEAASHIDGLTSSEAAAKKIDERLAKAAANLLGDAGRMLGLIGKGEPTVDEISEVMLDIEVDYKYLDLVVDEYIDGKED